MSGTFKAATEHYVVFQLLVDEKVPDTFSSTAREFRMKPRVTTLIGLRWARALPGYKGFTVIDSRYRAGGFA